jgi:hypothetical protein
MIRQLRVLYGRYRLAYPGGGDSLAWTSSGGGYRIQSPEVLCFYSLYEESGEGL